MKKFYTISLFFLFVFIFAFNASGQQINAIQSNCPSGNALPQSSIRARADGNIWYVPCDTFASVFFGNVDFTNATVTGLVAGSGTANFVPRFTASSTIGNTPLSWNNTLYNFTNTALDSQFTLELTPSTASGRFRIGDFTTTPTNFIDLNQSANTLTFDTEASIQFFQNTDNVYATFNAAAGTFTFQNKAGSSSAIFDGSGDLYSFLTQDFNVDTQQGVARIGDINGAADRTLFTIDATAKSFTFGDITQTAFFDLAGVNNFQYNRTITATGTTGNQTINKPVGTVNIVAGNSSIVITNSTVNTSSIVLATARTNDATCSVKNVVSGASSITITMTAACTAETSIGFFVTN